MGTVARQGLPAPKKRKSCRLAEIKRKGTYQCHCPLWRAPILYDVDVGCGLNVLSCGLLRRGVINAKVCGPAASATPASYLLKTSLATGRAEGLATLLWIVDFNAAKCLHQRVQLLLYKSRSVAFGSQCADSLKKPLSCVAKRFTPLWLMILRQQSLDRRPCCLKNLTSRQEQAFYSCDRISQNGKTEGVLCGRLLGLRWRGTCV